MEVGHTQASPWDPHSNLETFLWGLPGGLGEPEEGLEGKQYSGDMSQE